MNTSTTRTGIRFFTKVVSIALAAALYAVLRWGHVWFTTVMHQKHLQLR
jgi:hypothetical protein